MQFVGIADAGPGVFRFLPDGRRVQGGQVAGIFRQGAAQRHGAGAAFLQRRIVQKGVRHGVEDLMGKDRGLHRIAPVDFDVAGFNAGQYRPAAVQIRRLGKAVAHRLEHQRMVGDFDIAGGRVVLAGHLRRKHRGQQVVGAHPLQRRGHFLAAGMPQDRQGAGGVPAPAGAEDRRLQHRLGQHFLDGGRFQIVENIGYGHRQAGAQGEIQPVVGGRRL